MYLTTFKAKIKRINDEMHGGFNSEDKGALQKFAVGRLLMQFKQWMPATYKRRFGGRYYDAILEREREGYYRTGFRFIVSALKGSAELAKFKDSMNESDQANLRKAGFELSLFVILWALCHFLDLGDDDKYKKESKASAWARYTLLRLKMELSQITPTLDFFRNIVILQENAISSLKRCNQLINLVDITMWSFDEVDRGIYKGWPKYMVYLYKSIPYGHQIKRFWEADEDAAMFHYLQK